MKKSKVTCTKVFPEVPFAHRQPSHKGHCALIHGHNWRFEITFGANELDECGFVVDFGKMQFIKDMLEELDHALLLNFNDPELKFLTDTLDGAFARVVPVRDCSSEGLAVDFLNKINKLFSEHHPKTPFFADCVNRNVRAIRVTVYEDEKNCATAEEVG